MSLSDVTINRDAWGDPRVQFLAQLAGYADGIDTAVARMARLWARCTFLGTDVVPEYEVNACLQITDGARLLVTAGLGEQVEGGGIRVKGRYANDNGKDRLGWRTNVSERNVKGGQVRVARAVRGSDGRFGAGPARPAGHQPDPSNVQRPASDTSESLDDAGPATPASDQDLRSGSDQRERVDQDRVGSDPSEADPDQGRGGDLVPAIRPVQALRPLGDRLVNEFLTRVNDARRAIAAERGLGEVRNVALMDGGGTGERDLRRRLGESTDPERDLELVLTVAIAEARAPGGELRWLSWWLATEKAWCSKLSSTVAEAQRGRPQRAPAKSRNPFGYAEPRTDHPTSDELLPFGEKLTCK